MLSLLKYNHHQPLSVPPLTNERKNISLQMASESSNCCQNSQTDIHSWRQPLKEWLSICYQKETLYPVIDFLLVTLKDAEEKIKFYDSRLFNKKDVALKVDPSLLPMVFRKENWEEFLVCLGFILEMPDTLPIYNVVLVSVLLSTSISIELLTEVQSLLAFLKEIPFFCVRAILSLSQNDGNSLFRALTDVSIHHLSLENSSYKKTSEILYNQKPKFMEELGFLKPFSVLQWEKMPEKEERLVIYVFVLKMFFSDKLCEIKPIQV